MKNISCLSSEEMEAAVYSARFILEEISKEKFAELTGLPIGVVAAAYDAIFDGAKE